MAQITDTYLDTLCLYYEEEVEGEAYFAELADMASDPHQKACLILLAEVERHAADAVRPLIDKYRLNPRPSSDLIADGQDDARSSAPDWPDLLDAMHNTYDGYLDDFRRLEALGPQEDQFRLAFLTEHEVVVIAFLQRERANAPDSTAPLVSYLRASPDVMAAE